MQGVSDPTRVQLLDAAALCGHLVPDGSVYGFLAKHRGRLFPDELFADLFPSGRGRPSVPADVVATVMVLQALEGLSDREATAHLTQHIGWKVACGLGLTDPGFHPTVLTLWRARLRASTRPERIFAAVRQVVQATGVLAGRQRRALDSTLLDDAVTTQDTVTQLVAGIRRVRRLIPTTRGVTLTAHDYDRVPGKPACAWDDQAARERLVTGLVSDALAVLVSVEGRTWTVSRPTRSGCWAWSLGRTSNRVRAKAAGGSLARSPRTGWSASLTPRPGTCTRASPAPETATRPTWPSNQRPG